MAGGLSKGAVWFDLTTNSLDLVRRLNASLAGQGVVGRPENGSPLMYGAGLPGMPIVSNTLPSTLHLRTVWSPSSVQ